MKSLKYIAMSMFCTLALGACQDKDYEIAAPILAPVDAELITGQLVGDDYVWSWPQSAGGDMEVSLYNGTTFTGSERVIGNAYTHRNIDTNIEYTYVFKLTDGKNVSKGVVKRYTRPGASTMSGLSMAQIEKAGGYDAKIEWTANPSAEHIYLVANAGSRTISETLDGNTISYTIPNVNFGEEWTVTLTAENAQGKSLPATASLKIGKTAIGFLSVYPLPMHSSLTVMMTRLRLGFGSMRNIRPQNTFISVTYLLLQTSNPTAYCSGCVT